MSIAPKTKHAVLRRFCHICGTLLSGKSAWKPTSDSTACWDEKATYPLSPNFGVSFSDRIDMPEPDFPLPVIQLDFDADIPWVSKRGTAILTDNEAKKEQIQCTLGICQNSGKQSLKLTLMNTNIADVPIDHSFLNFKKELTDYGYRVGKISMKEKSVSFEKK